MASQITINSTCFFNSLFRVTKKIILHLHMVDCWWKKFTGDCWMNGTNDPSDRKCFHVHKLVQESCYSIANALELQYIPRNMHTVFALLCFVVVIHWLILPYPSGLLHWHCGNLMIAPVPAKQPWWIWINTSCEFIMNDCITTTKQSTTNPVHISWDILYVFLALTHQRDGAIMHMDV